MAPCLCHKHFKPTCFKATFTSTTEESLATCLCSLAAVSLQVCLTFISELSVVLLQAQDTHHSSGSTSGLVEMDQEMALSEIVTLCKELSSKLTSSSP